MAYVRIIRDHSITSDTIRFMLHEQFSHIGYKLTGTDEWLDCRLDGGVNIRPADSVRDTAHVDFTFPGIEQAIEYGKTFIGKEQYDIGNIINFIDPRWPIDPHKGICSRFLRFTSKLTCGLINPSIADYEIAPAHFLFPIGAIAGVEELDRWPKDLKL